jgi:hypothetical protein
VVDCVRGEQALNDMMSGASRQQTTSQEGTVDDARQAGGGQCGVIRWQAMQGNMAVDNETRGGGWRT